MNFMNLNPLLNQSECSSPIFGITERHSRAKALLRRSTDDHQRDNHQADALQSFNEEVGIIFYIKNWSWPFLGIPFYFEILHILFCIHHNDQIATLGNNFKKAISIKRKLVEKQPASHHNFSVDVASKQILNSEEK